MKIEAKTAHGLKVEVEMTGEETMERLKEKLHGLTNIPRDSQKLIHNGRLLLESGSIFDSGIKDGDGLIVLTRRTKPAPLPRDTTPEPDPVAIRKAVAHLAGKEEKEGDEDQEGEPELRNQIQNLVNSFFGNYNFAPPPRAPAPAAAAAAAAPPVQASAEAVAQLTDMGFTEAMARRALIINRNSIQRATDWLLEHGDDAEAAGEGEGGEGERANDAASAAAEAGRGGEVVGEGGSVPVAISPAAFQGTSGLSAEQRLLEMGFQSEEVTRALRDSGGNYEAACAILLGENDDQDDNALDEDSPIVRAIFSNSVIGAGLSNPRVMQAFRAMIEDPSSVTNYIADPEIGPLILQVHAILQGILPALNTSAPNT